MEYISKTVLLCGFLSILCIALCLFWAKIQPKHLFYSRKTLHILCIGILAISILSVNKDNVLYFVLLLFLIEIILIVAVLKGFFYSEGRRSWGIVYFLPAVISLLLIFPLEKFFIFQSVLILAFADGFSALFGRMIEQFLQTSKNLTLLRIKEWNIIRWGSDKKTIFGSIIGFVMVFLICYLHFPFNRDGVLLLAFLIISFIVTITEIIGYRGNDNFFMPVVSFVLLKIFIEKDVLRGFTDMGNPFFWIYTLLFIIAAWAFLKLKWLSISGIVFAGLIAFFLMLANWSLFPMIAFFVSGTLAGKLNSNVNSDIKHSKPRDVFQVLANGGVTLILSSLFLIYKVWYLEVLMLVSISVACADTLSSEIGMKYGKRTFGILNFKHIPKGVSGGVSWAGFGGALFGAIIIGFFDIHYFWTIVLFGFFGSVLDSVIGLLFQAKYLSQGQITDIEDAQLVGGFRFVTNDMVNVLSNIIAVGICGFCFLL